MRASFAGVEVRAPDDVQAEEIIADTTFQQLNYCASVHEQGGVPNTKHH